PRCCVCPASVASYSACTFLGFIPQCASQVWATFGASPAPPALADALHTQAVSGPKGWAGFVFGGLGFVYGHGAAKPIPHSPPKSFIAREGTEKVLFKNLSIKKRGKAHI